MLSIRLLGATEVQLDDKRLTIRRRKSRALLYYLAAHPEPVSRNRLLSTLWADHTADTARSNLRSTLYNLRRELGEYLQSDTETVWLAGELWVDVRALLAQAAALQSNPTGVTHLTDSLPAAFDESNEAGLYGGDFLADFDAPDTPEFDEWVAVERERLRRVAIRVCEQMGRLYTHHGRAADALRAVETALRLDPFQEDLQRTALALLYHGGNRAGAIRRYEEFGRLLEMEMGVPPMAETHALYAAIANEEPLPERYAHLGKGREQPGPGVLDAPRRANGAVQSGSPSPEVRPGAGTSFPLGGSVNSATAVEKPGASRFPTATGLAVPFVGRARELQQLQGWLGQGRLIFVEGAPGLGKTAILDRLLEQSRQAAWIVLAGRARELESRLPYQPFIEALRSAHRHNGWQELRQAMNVADIWQREVGRLVPELCPAGEWEKRAHESVSPGEADASRLWESIYQWLAGLAQVRPVLVFLDDLHWADASSVGLLGYLTRRAADEGTAITLLAAGHPPGAQSTTATLLQSLVREELLHHLTLGPLSGEDVTTLARHLSPHYGHPLGHWLYRSSEGIPFVLVHLLRHAQESGLLDEEGVVNIHRLPSEPVVPQTIYTLIQARLESLSESARRVLDAAVVVGREFDFEVAARASALSDSAGLDALDELRRKRLIVNVDGERFAFDHTLTREVAYREVGETRNRLLHRRVAAALESLYPDRLDEMAGLLAHHYSEGNAPQQAYPYAVLAANRAVAVAAWQSAIDAYRHALTLLPATLEGTPQATQTGSVHQADTRLTLVTALGEAYLHAGHMDEATQALQEAVTSVSQAGAEGNPVEIMRRALPALSQALISQARYDEVIDLAESLQHFDDPFVRFTVDFIWASALSVSGCDLATATAHLLAAEQRLTDETDDETGGETDASVQVRLAQISFELGSIDAQQGRLDEAIVRYRRALELTSTLESEDMARWHILAANNLAYHLHLVGDSTAGDIARRGYELARERGFLHMNGYLLSTLGEIALAQGDWVQAEDYFAQGLAQARRLGQPERIAGITANLAHVAVAQGDQQAAVAHLENALAQAEAIPNPYLSAQIRLWLAPLLPPTAAREQLDAAHTIIDSAGYGRLQAQWRELDRTLNAPSQ